jgi:DNA/RNA-binding domain of Phe-tRNA-synthetase-like protein
MTLAGLAVDKAVTGLRPDFAAAAVLVSGVRNQPTTADSDGWLAEAEAAARAVKADGPHPHIVAWQEAYRAFGAKPQRTPASVEALWQRAAKGELPRVNWLVDLYNAISVRYVLPVGGEDAARFVGSLRLIRASGTEPFETVRDGTPIVERPAPGEVVWADEAGVTCRRWNWRQGTRTRLTEHTRAVLFLLERLEPLELTEVEAAAAVLTGTLQRQFPSAVIERRWLGAAIGLPGAS